MLLAEIPSYVIVSFAGIVGFVIGATTFYFCREDKIEKSLNEIKQRMEERTFLEVGKNGIHKR